MSFFSVGKSSSTIVDEFATLTEMKMGVQFSGDFKSNDIPSVCSSVANDKGKWAIRQAVNRVFVNECVVHLVLCNANSKPSLYQ